MASPTTSPNGTHMSEPGEDVAAGAATDESRDQALSSLKRKRKFVGDVVAYLAVNGALWLIWALGDRSIDGGIPWPAWVSLIWGVFLAVDAWRTYGLWPQSLHRPITEAEIQREMERMKD